MGDPHTIQLGPYTLNRSVVFNLWETGEASALFYVTLLLLASEGIQMEIPPISPEADDIVIAEFVKDVFDAIPGEKALNKVQASTTLLTTDAFEQDTQGFLVITSGLRGYTPSDMIIQEITAEDAALAIVEAGIMRGDPLDLSEPVQRIFSVLESITGLDIEELGEQDIDQSKALVALAAAWMSDAADDFKDAGFPEEVYTALSPG